MSRGRIAAAWALATFVALAALSRGPGVSASEAAIVADGDPSAPAVPSPPLARALARGGHAVGASLGLSHVRSFRLGSAVAGALLSALIAAAAFGAAGAAGAILAPAFFWLAPRHLHAGLVATPDVSLAALALAAVLAWRRAGATAARARRVGWAALAGVLLGAAVLARADAWVLLPALAVHALATLALARRAPAGSPPGAAPAAIFLLAPAAVLTVAAGWPAALRLGAAPWLPPPGVAAALLLPLAAVPAALLFAIAGGVAHALVRIVRALRTRAPSTEASDDLLLLLAASAALAGAALAHAPPGARPFLHAMPFLAVLAARAVLRGAAVAWPSRARPLAAAMALVLLYPGVRAAVRHHPHGASAWNEILGGAPGGASRGLRRQDGGEAVAAVLDAVNERAAPGARIWWAGLAPAAIALYGRDGRLRPDIVASQGPADADVAVVALDGGSRDDEYRAWSAFRTARPAMGVYLDEVPLVLVYARAGAWR